MYLSRIHLRTERLKPDMLLKWKEATPYAAHQWLWQLFPGQEERTFLFRQEPQQRFFVLSESPPIAQHALFLVETKTFEPVIAAGLAFDFQLRVNPVITRQKKRYDVMMDAKYQARAQGEPKERWWAIQTEAACRWLERQGEKHGFVLIDPSVEEFDSWAGHDTQRHQPTGRPWVTSYQQHSFQRQAGQTPIVYSSVDFTGVMKITDAAKFQQVLYGGLGKSKSLGCGLLMIKRRGL
ncbi:hypothetical protein PANNVG_02906 [Pantoea sp. Nvir]|uniref:type I-E CRISPR-associated protein Cas6/Cse3/CasE n=1 Tax=Pantoea sp. Nvir TaxID=2576760 RepID=UPI0030CAB5A9